MTGDVRHDVAIVGGGIAGATLGYVLARAGLDVIVLERQSHHRDRVLGEAMAPWGVAEADAMGVFDLMRPQGTVLGRVFAFDAATDAASSRSPEMLGDVVPGVPGVFGVGNPALAAAMAGHAAGAGAEFVWSAQVRDAEPPAVVINVDGAEQTISARMIVGADGKASAMRHRLGIVLSTAGPHAQSAGMLATDLGADVPIDAVTTGIDDSSLRVVFPQGDGQARLYHMFAADRENPFVGPGRADRFLEAFANSPIPWGDGVASATPAGPCSTYPIHDAWTAVPHVPGAVLVGDAAGYSNPLCAQGLSICIRDVRLVAEALTGCTEWSGGLFDEYTADRARRMAALRTFAQFFHLANVPGPLAPLFRQRIRDVVADDPDAAAVLATIHSGPDRVPSYAVDRSWIEATFGVRLGAEPAVIA